MTKVKLLTETQAQSLFGVKFKPLHEFSPIKDNNGNFVISLECAEQTENPDFLWVKQLPEIDFVRSSKTLDEIIDEMKRL